MASETEAKAEVVAVTQGMEQYCAVPALCTCSTENLLWLHRKEKRNTETFCIGDECSASSTTQLYKDKHWRSPQSVTMLMLVLGTTKTAISVRRRQGFC